MSLLIDRIDETIAALVRERRRLAGDPLALPDAAYQGAPGAFSEDAAFALLGASARLSPSRTLDEVFDKVASHQAQWGVVPIENTLAGPVPRCAELLRRYGVKVRREHVRQIRHAVIGLPGARLEEIRAIRSHPVALAQCSRFLAAHPGVRSEPAFDTAGAVAEIVSRSANDEAAIASFRAATVYGAAVLAGDVQDSDANFTRFVLFEL